MTPTSTLNQPSVTTRPRVLVVDDEPTLVEMINDVVGGQLPCRIYSARNLAEARTLLASQPVELVVTDVHLPDGIGTELLDELREHQPHASAIVVTGAPTVDRAIDAIRHGAFDFLPKPFSADELIARMRGALDRQRASARKEQRLDRLRDAVRRLNAARKLVSKKVDLLCNDLISAYTDLSRQLDVVRTQEAFRKLTHEAKDLEQLLCHAMDWLLRQLGYSNIAIWLASDEEKDLQLGAYMKYTIEGKLPLSDAMKQGIVRKINHDGFAHWSAAEAADQLTAAELKHLSGQTFLACHCTYLAETLAVVILFRDDKKPYSAEDADVLRAIAPLFATALATAVHGDAPDGAAPDKDTPFSNGESVDDTPPPPKKNKKDEADWWKRGEPPPF